MQFPSHVLMFTYFRKFVSFPLSILLYSCLPSLCLKLLSFSFRFLSFSLISNPILVNTSSLHPSTVCVPISFNITGPDQSLAILPEILLVPPVIKDNTLAKGSQAKDVYIIKDGKINVDNNNSYDNDNETS